MRLLMRQISCDEALATKVLRPPGGGVMYSSEIFDLWVVSHNLERLEIRLKSDISSYNYSADGSKKSTHVSVF